MHLWFQNLNNGNGLFCDILLFIIVSFIANLVKLVKKVSNISNISDIIPV